MSDKPRKRETVSSKNSNKRENLSAPKFKGALALIISGLALVVSGVTAYYTIIRQIDDLSVIISDYPVAFRFEPGKFSFAVSDSTLAFVNLGNRPALILSVRLFFVLPHKLTRDDCAVGDPDDFHLFETNFESTVIRERDIATRKIHPTGEMLTPDEVRPSNKANLTFDVDKSRVGENKIPVEICFEITFATPARAKGTALLSVIKYEAAVSKGGPGVGVDFESMHLDRVTPRVLVKESSTIFTR